MITNAAVSVFAAYFDAVSYFVVFMVLAISIAGQVLVDYLN